MSCVYKILYLNTLSIRFNNNEEEEMCTDFPIFRNQRVKDHSIRSKKIKDTKESFQIPAFCFVKMRYSIQILYKRGKLIKEKKKCVRLPYFIRKQSFKDIFIK